MYMSTPQKLQEMAFHKIIWFNDTFRVMGFCCISYPITFESVLKHLKIAKIIKFCKKGRYLKNLPVFALVDDPTKKIDRVLVVICARKKLKKSHNKIFIGHVRFTVNFGRCIFFKYSAKLNRISTFQVTHCL